MLVRAWSSFRVEAAGGSEPRDAYRLDLIVIATLVAAAGAACPGPVGGIPAHAARTTAGDGRRGRRGPLPLRADGAVAPPALPARPGPGRLHPRPVVEPVVVVPDGRGPGGRPGPPRPLPVLDLRLLDGRPDPVLGLAAAARPGRGAAEVRPRRDRRGVRPDGRRRAQHGRAAGEDDGPGQRGPAVAARQRPAVRGARGRPGGPRPVPPRPVLHSPGRRSAAWSSSPRRTAGAASTGAGWSDSARGSSASRNRSGRPTGGWWTATGRRSSRNGCARACRPASTSWSGGRPSSRACRSWGWPRGSRPTPSSRTGATRPGPAGGDGLVPYDSAHLDGVASEVLVSSGHLCQDHPAVIARGPAHPRRARGPLTSGPAARGR